MLQQIITNNYLLITTVCLLFMIKTKFRYSDKLDIEKEARHLLRNFNKLQLKKLLKNYSVRYFNFLFTNLCDINFSDIKFSITFGKFF